MADVTCWVGGREEPTAAAWVNPASLLWRSVASNDENGEAEVGVGVRGEVEEGVGVRVEVGVEA